jgi:hypothetical protein
MDDGYTEGRRVQDAGINGGVDGGVDTRVTIREAATLLGISEGAVRKRVDRGTLRHTKGADGRVYVHLPGEPFNGVAGGIPDGTPGGDDAYNPHESNALTSEMRARIDFLEEELRRKDAILLNMTEAMKAITASSPEAPSEARGWSMPPSEEQEKGTGPADDAEAQKPSWWRRVFLGE